MVLALYENDETKELEPCYEKIGFVLSNYLKINRGV
jgi:hypothetical protein